MELQLFLTIYFRKNCVRFKINLKFECNEYVDNYKFCEEMYSVGCRMEDVGRMFLEAFSANVIKRYNQVEW